MVKEEIQNIKLRFGIIGNAEGLNRAIDIAMQVAPTDLSVLITGESGVGKENFPQIIHLFSRRKHGKYIAVNCGAIPEGTIDSELFGHEKGSFTGAIGDRNGYFAEANGGTIFLDEIGDMPLQMQVKLLRVLQERVYERVGSNRQIKANVRVIAATHRNLEEMIKEGKFREDLFYRLNVFPIITPPLRERADDIPLLLQELINRYSREHKVGVRFTQRAMESLMQHEWSGNVRELSNLVERMIIIHPNEIVDNKDLPRKYQYAIEKDGRLDEPMDEKDALFDILCDLSEEECKEENQAGISSDNASNDVTSVLDEFDESDNDLAAPFSSVLPPDGVNLKEMVTQIEIDMIKRALEATDGVVARAAEMLQMRRTTLVEKIKKYEISTKE